MGHLDQHLHSGFGDLVSTDGTSARVIYVLQSYLATVGDKDPEFFSCVNVQEFDFRRSEHREETMHEKQGLVLHLHDGRTLGVEWCRDLGWKATTEISIPP